MFDLPGSRISAQPAFPRWVAGVSTEIKYELFLRPHNLILWQVRTKGVSFGRHPPYILEIIDSNIINIIHPPMIFQTTTSCDFDAAVATAALGGRETPLRRTVRQSATRLPAPSPGKGLGKGPPIIDRRLDLCRGTVVAETHRHSADAFDPKPSFGRMGISSPIPFSNGNIPMTGGSA
jgi:hypothetical protein